MTERVLVTGATGFAGSHLIDYLRNIPGLEVYGTKRRRSDTSNLTDLTNILDCEITDTLSVHGIINRIQPNYIFHPGRS